MKTEAPLPIRVLVVEDDALNLKLIADLLTYRGYEVAATRFGEEALELAREERPDVILLDIQLPDISGLEVASRLKADRETRAIPIAAVTAFAMRGDERRIRDSGCDAYISKPVMSLESLIETIDSLAQQGARS